MTLLQTKFTQQDSSVARQFLQFPIFLVLQYKCGKITNDLHHAIKVILIGLMSRTSTAPAGQLCAMCPQ